LLILYDAIGTLADSVGHHLNKQVSQWYINVCMVNPAQGNISCIHASLL
jgi:hypothetical protein